MAAIGRKSVKKENTKPAAQKKQDASVKPAAQPELAPVKSDAAVPVAEAEVKPAVEVKPVAEAKPVAAKTVAKKAAAKKPAAKPAEKKTAEKKTAVKKAAAAKSEVKSIVNLQFSGKSYSQEDFLQMAGDVWKYDLKKKAGELESVELYVKPEENMVYYVFNGDITGSFLI